MLQNDVKNGAAKQQPLGRAQGTWRLRSGPTLAPEAWPRDWGPEVCTLPSFTTGHPVLLSPLLQITKKRPQRGINIRGQEDTARNEAALSRVLSSPFPSGPGLGRTTLAPHNQQCEWTQNPELGRAQALSPGEEVATGGLSWPSGQAQPGLWSVPTVGRRTTVLSSPHDVVPSWHSPAEAAALDRP